MSENTRLMRNILIAVLSVTLLGAGYYFAVKWEPETEEYLTDSAPKLAYITEEYRDDVASIHIKNEFSEYDIVSKEVNDKTQYLISGLENVPIDAQITASAFGSFITLTASREISGGEMSEFGLDGSKYYTITKKDGSEVTILIGDEISGGGEFYCAKKGNSKIYTISAYVVENFARTPEDYRVRTITDIPDVKTIEKFSVYKNEKPVMKIRTATQNEMPQGVQTSLWMCEYPWKESASDEKLAELFEGFASIEAIGFADDGSGFDYRIEIKTGDNLYNLSIGAETDNGVYLRDENSGIIYLVDKSLKGIADKINPNDYISKFVWLTDISKVARIRIVSAEHKIEMETDGYRINGNQVAESDFKNKYRAVIGVSFMERKYVSDYGNILMTVSYEFKDGNLEEVKFYEYDERHIIAIRPDGETGLVIRSELDKMLRELI